jgi:hypothetical protein
MPDAEDAAQETLAPACRPTATKCRTRDTSISTERQPPTAERAQPATSLPDPADQKIPVIRHRPRLVRVVAEADVRHLKRVGTPVRRLDRLRPYVFALVIPQ